MRQLVAAAVAKTQPKTERRLCVVCLPKTIASRAEETQEEMKKMPGNAKGDWRIVKSPPDGRPVEDRTFSAD